MATVLGIFIGIWFLALVVAVLVLAIAKSAKLIAEVWYGC